MAYNTGWQDDPMGRRIEKLMKKGGLSGEDED